MFLSEVSKGKSIIVPDLTTMTVEEITDWIIKNNLKIEFEEIYDELEQQAVTIF